MTDQERNICQVASAALLGFSRLGFVVFITTPALFILLQHKEVELFHMIAIAVFLVSVCIVALKSWHIYFDALLFKTLGLGTAGIGEIDLLLLKVFKKDIQGKPLTERIDACYALSRKLFILVGVHVLLFISILIYLLNT
ncbi:hypothetical protein [uncultured Cytophaga sp.]|uniref:hypothetical protein n=1 Tax=uncultured Cytophaga sp. TaxID=160238 RepID=UPI00260C33A3|nr:hypothetical protein [uncultured Cytophaga sp.]